MLSYICIYCHIEDKDDHKDEEKDDNKDKEEEEEEEERRMRRRTATMTRRRRRRRLIVIMTKAIATGRPSSRLRRVDPTSFSLLHRSKRLSLTPEIRFVFVFPQIKTLIVDPSNRICNCVCVHTKTPLSTQNLWCLTQTPKLFPLQSLWCLAQTPRFWIHGDGC